MGALVVHPSQTVVGWPEWDEDLLVQMADWYHTFSTELLELFMRVCTLIVFWHGQLVKFSQPDVGLTGTPGDEPVPDSSVRVLAVVRDPQLDLRFQTINGLGQWQDHGEYFTFNLERGKT